MAKVLKNGKIIEVPDSEFADDSISILEQKKDSVRSRRNSLLSQTDWRFRSDMNPSQAWVDYCQALRDIPQQAGFPDNVIWPNEPE